MNIEAIRKQYKRNEANNDHTANGILLAKHFGTEHDQERMQHIKEVHERSQSIPYDLYKERYEITQPLYQIMMGIQKT